MDKTEFRNQLIKDSQRVRAFSEEFLLEPLPAECRFRLKLNSSHDLQPQPDDITLHPEDDSEELAIRNRSLTTDEVTDLLWRAGEVPVWIDVSVVSLTSKHTIIELRAAGRFTANEDYLYYSDCERKSPFGLKGPVLPPSYDDKNRNRFSIFHRASCWTLDEYEAIGTRKMLAWSLELGGPDFDDDFLSQVDEFKNLEGLELKFSPVQGPGLHGCNRMPKLRFMRISIFPQSNSTLFSLTSLPKLPCLEILTVNGLVSPPDRLSNLSANAINLKELGLGCESIDSALVIPELPQLNRLSISAGRIGGEVHVPELDKLDSLTLSGPFTDEAIGRLLEQIPSVQSLHLCGTQASDWVVEFIRSHRKINYANLPKTSVDSMAIQSLCSDRPDLRIHTN